MFCSCSLGAGLAPGTQNLLALGFVLQDDAVWMSLCVSFLHGCLRILGENGSGVRARSGGLLVVLSLIRVNQWGRSSAASWSGWWSRMIGRVCTG